MNATKQKRDVAQEVTNRIIAEMENGCVPWQKPWKATGGALPRSMSTGKVYQGINLMLLAFAPYSSPWWGTFKQIQKLGGHVRKGEKSTVIVFYKTLIVDAKDGNGEVIRDQNGDPETKGVPLLRAFNVFNAQQCDGLGDKYGAPAPSQTWEHTPIERCEAVVNDYVNRGPMLLNTGDGSDGAFYDRFNDYVKTPRMELFSSLERYYSTTYHELTHSTGHERRLNRDTLKDATRFGDTNYSKEELIAEIGAAILCARTGLTDVETIPQTAAYVEGWLRALRNDKSLILKAAAAAQKATDLIYPQDETEQESDED